MPRPNPHTRPRLIRFTEPGQMKICARCMTPKILHMDFYMCSGRYRSECKACTNKKNMKYQREHKSWQRYPKERKREYELAYYAANREKFAAYRKKFAEAHPNYHKDYYRRRRDERQEN